MRNAASLRLTALAFGIAALSLRSPAYAQSNAGLLPGTVAGSRITPGTSTWVGAQPAGGIYAYISLIASAYWFAYFLVILPLLGVIEKPLPQPATIEDDFNAHYSPSTVGTPVAAE